MMRIFHIQAGIVLCILLLASVHTEAQLNETLKLTAPYAEANDQLGWSVAVSGTTTVIGARKDDAAAGLLFSSSGAAYLFDTTTGNQLFRLTASDADMGDWFGSSVAISGTMAIIGAPSDHDAAYESGSAYVFDVTTGDQRFKLTASDAAFGDEFGFSVAISGNIAVVGTRTDADAGPGSAYIFHMPRGNQLFKLTASDAKGGDSFGSSVAISGTMAIIGATNRAAYVFDATSGKQLFKLTASDQVKNDGFGWSVAISGNIAVVGAGGSAYVFDVTTGKQLFKLTSSDTVTETAFGSSVAISGNMIVVSAGGNRWGEIPGAAYVFDVTTGKQLFKLTASDAAKGDSFGWSVAVAGTTVVVGAANDDNAGHKNTGSTYIFNNVRKAK